MDIRISRITTNHLYTEAIVTVGGKELSHTVEVSEGRLPDGIYATAMGLDHLGRHVIDLLYPAGGDVPPRPTGWHIGLGHSWISSEKHHTLCFGRPFFPGAVMEGEEDFDRLFERFRKSMSRNTPVIVEITSKECRTERHPHFHWSCR